MAGPSVETAIWLALRGRVESLALTPALAVAWPNKAFTPPQANGKPLPYLEVRHLPNANDRLAVNSGGSHRRQGILQIALKYPVALDHDAAVGVEIAGKVAAHFPADLPMKFQGVTAKVEKAPDVGQAFRPDGEPYWNTPVSIRCRTFK